MERPENIIVKKTGDYDMLRQVYRSGTSIGANTAESQYAQSRADFLTKLSIALKEANETKYWIGRLHTVGILSDKEFVSINADNEEIVKILISITGTVKRKQQG